MSRPWGPEHACVAEVLAKRSGGDRFGFGSGYRIGPGQVLTAFHVVRDAEASGDLEIRLLGAPGSWAPARVTWRDAALDVALLEYDAAGGDSPRWGRVPRGLAADCLAVGFPAAVAFDRTREADGIEGWVKPFSGLKEGLLHVEVRGAPPADAAGWSGASGAALFSGGMLIGVIVRVPRAFGGGRVKAVPLERFSRALAATGLAVPDPLPEVQHPERAAMAFRAAWDVADPVAGVLQAASRFVVGRDEQLDALDGHVAAGGREPLLVTAPAGQGKTSLLARWVDEHGEGCAIAAHTFSSASGLTSVADANRHLLAQVRLEAIGAAALPGEPVPGDREMFAELHAAVRDWPRSSEKPLVIVVDALDEAQGGFPPAWPQPLPERVSVIASARPDEAPSPAHLRGWERAEPVALPAFDDAALRRWLQQVAGGAVADLAADDALVAALRELTGGLPLYLHYLGDDLAAAVAAGDDPTQTLRTAPRGLQRYIAEQIHRLATTEQLGHEAQSLFAFVAVAVAPLPEADLERLTGMTVFGLLQLPTAVTRWFIRARTPDGLLTYAFGHPLLADEFRSALGRLDGAANDDLLADCRQWASHRGGFALTGFARQLLASDLAEELYELARDDAYVAAQQRAFPGRHAALETVAAAIEAAAGRDDVADLASLVLRHGELADVLAMESPLDALRAGDLERATSLCRLAGPIPAVLWRLLLAWELLSEQRTAAARELMIGADPERLAETNGAWAGCAATLLVAVWELDSERSEALARALLHGRGEFGQVVALGALAMGLIERGRVEEGLRLSAPWVTRHREMLKHAARKLAEQGDVAGARRAVNLVSPRRGHRAEALAAAGLGAARRGDAESAGALFAQAREDLEVYTERMPFTAIVVAERLAQAGEVAAARSMVADLGDDVQSARAFAAIGAARAEAGGDGGPDLHEARARLRRSGDASQHVVLSVARGHSEAGDTVAAAELLATVEAPDDESEAINLAAAYALAGGLQRTRALLRGLRPTWRAMGFEQVAAELAASGAFEDALDLLSSSDVPWPGDALARIAHHAQSRGADQLARDVLADCLTRHARWVRADPAGPLSKALEEIASACAEAEELVTARLAAEAIPAGFERGDALASLGIALAQMGDLGDAREVAEALKRDGAAYDASTVLAAVAAAELAAGHDNQGAATLANLERPDAASTAWGRLLDASDDRLVSTCLRLLQERGGYMSAETRSRLALALTRRGAFESAVAGLLTHVSVYDGTLPTVGELARLAPDARALETLVTAACELQEPALAASALAEIALAGDDRALELAQARLRGCVFSGGNASHRLALVATDLAVAQTLRGNGQEADELLALAMSLVDEAEEPDLLRRQVERFTTAGRLEDARDALSAMPIGFARAQAVVAAMNGNPPTDDLVVAAADGNDFVSIPTLARHLVDRPANPLFRGGSWLAIVNSSSRCRRGWGPAMGVIKRIELSVSERAELERVVAAASSEVRMVERARIVLCASEGLKGAEIAERVGCSLPTVVKWRGRYGCNRIEGLRDAPRPGPPLTHGPEVRALLIAKACTRPPATAEGARQERWTYEQLGAAVGMSGSQAHAILARAEIKPHRTDYWIMSDFSQPQFEERCAAICGLYVDPPENVLVVSIDEKTGIQAKAPTKPDVPPAPGQPARREHEYTRNGTQCLFAALKVHLGDVLAMASKTRNRFDLIRFLEHLDAELPVVDGQRIVAITDNLSTRATQEVQDWLKAHPRWSFQFTPTHASWLNQVEIFVRHEAPCERRERTNNSQPCRLRCRPRADAAARRSWGQPWRGIARRRREQPRQRSGRAELSDARVRASKTERQSESEAVVEAP